MLLHHRAAVTLMPCVHNSRFIFFGEDFILKGDPEGEHKIFFYAQRRIWFEIDWLGIFIKLFSNGTMKDGYLVVCFFERGMVINLKNPGCFVNKCVNFFQETHLSRLLQFLISRFCSKGAETVAENCRTINYLNQLYFRL